MLTSKDTERKRHVLSEFTIISTITSLAIVIYPPELQSLLQAIICKFQISSSYFSLFNYLYYLCAHKSHKKLVLAYKAVSFYFLDTSIYLSNNNNISLFEILINILVRLVKVCIYTFLNYSIRFDKSLCKRFLVRPACEGRADFCLYNYHA